MNPSIKSRAAAFIASVLVTFVTVHLAANYAYPESSAPVMAKASVNSAGTVTR